jgi:hypothetical protein
MLQSDDRSRRHLEKSPIKRNSSQAGVDAGMSLNLCVLLKLEIKGVCQSKQVKRFYHSMKDLPETKPSNNVDFRLWSFQLQSDSKLLVRSRKDLEAILIEHALNSNNFRNELITNPKRAIEEELNMSFPSNLSINILEDNDINVHLVIPWNPYEDFTDNDLKLAHNVTLDEIAASLVEQQYSTFFDKRTSINTIVKAWSDKAYKALLLTDANKLFITQGIIDQSMHHNIIARIETQHDIFITIPILSNTSSGNWVPPEIIERQVSFPKHSNDKLTDIGIPLKKSQQLSQEIEKLFKKHHLTMSKETILSIAYSTDLDS